MSARFRVVGLCVAGDETRDSNRGHHDFIRGGDTA